jgi:hypothetical protein
MPKTIQSYTKIEIEKMIDDKLNLFKKETYDQLNKLRNKIININDIQKVLNRK